MKNLTLSLCSLIFTFLFLEAVIRILPYNEIQTNNEYLYRSTIGKWKDREPYHFVQQKFDATLDPRGYYEPTEYIVDFSYNQYGARWLHASDQEIIDPVAVLLGDSFTYGSGLRYRDTLAYKFQKQLNDDGFSLSVLNFGQSSADTLRCLEIYRAIAGNLPPHRIVLYAMHLNDLISFHTSFVIRNQLLESLDGTIFSNSKSLKFVLYKWNTIVERQKKIDYLTDKGVFKRKKFQENWPAILQLRNEAKANQAEFLVLILPILIELKEDTFRPIYEEIIRRLRVENIPYIDLTGGLREYEDSELWILPVDQHPNEIATTKFATKLVTEFKPILEQLD